MLKGKTILLGVTGGIAAYKAAALASALVKLHANVEVIMTKNATEFITPLTFEQLTGNRTMTDTFNRNFVHQVEHISLAERRKPDLVGQRIMRALTRGRISKQVVDSHFWDSSQPPSLSLPFLNFVLFLSCLHYLSTSERLFLAHPLLFSQFTMAKSSPTFQVEPTQCDPGFYLLCLLWHIPAPASLPVNTFRPLFQRNY